MEELLNEVPCGFLAFGDDGSVRAANATLLGMVGYSQDEVVGQHIERLFNVGTRIFYQTHWFPLLQMHGHAEEVFLLLRHKSGESISVLSYAKQRASDQASYDCVLVPVRERAKYDDELLRARKALEEANAELQAQKLELEEANEQLESQAIELELQQQQLRDQAERLEDMADALRATNGELQRRTDEAVQLRATAEQSNKAKSAFLATMSHELRTPLNAIGGYLQILELGIAGPLSDNQRDIVDRVDKSSRHLLRLINEVLDLARIEAGYIQYENTEASLADVVRDVLPMVEPQAAGKDLQFEADVPSDLMMTGDVEKVTQILLNMISNAIKFTGPGGMVRLSATQSKKPARVHIHVTDTGIGIPEDKLELIFQPFVQVDSSRTRAAEGSGLGLAISRDLARGMGGDLNVKSVVGSGSTFTLSLASPE